MTIDAVFEKYNTTISRDLKLNLKKFVEEGALTQIESHQALLAVATSVEHTELEEYARHKLKELDQSAEHIQEAAEVAAIMGMLNIYYRFKHFVSHGEEGNKTDYQQAGLRMTSLGRPAIGKTNFEMLAFAVSCINGCEVCVTSHEKALHHAEVTADKIHDLARLAAVVKGLKALEHANR